MRTILLFFGIFLVVNVSGQTDTDSLREARKGTLFGLPIVYVTPETSWAFGLAGIYSFYADREDPQPTTRPSQLQLAFAYTLNQQILFYLPYDLFTTNNEYRFNGEVGFYRYTYFYYGIGNTFDDYPGELFGISFARLRLNALRKIRKNVYVGLRHWLEVFDLDQVVTDGLLDDPQTLGTEGGISSGLGPMLQIDSRDQLFFPRKGLLLEASLVVNGALLGSDYSYSKFTLNASRYLTLTPRTVLALNAYLEFTQGAAPFNQLALLGGTRKLRGYYEGRFRDNHLLIVQGEWRFPIWKRFKGTLFGGAGVVANQISELSPDNLRPAFGAGLRYLALKQQQIHIRFDLAYGQGDNSGFYLTIGEAF